MKLFYVGSEIYEQVGRTKKTVKSMCERIGIDLGKIWDDGRTKLLATQHDIDRIKEYMDKLNQEKSIKHDLGGIEKKDKFYGSYHRINTY